MQWNSLKATTEKKKQVLKVAPFFRGPKIWAGTEKRKAKLESKNNSSPEGKLSEGTGT